MYNLRYHIASLVAVFIALSVGLLLGNVVAERGMITDQTGALVADLQARFDDIQATNADLQVGLERDRAFAEAAVVPLTAGQLTGKRVALIVGTGVADGLDPAAEAITAAGGTTFTVSLQTAALGLDKAEPAGLAGYFTLRGAEMAKPGAALERQVAEALVAEWRAGADHPLTQLLVGEGLVTLESTTDTASVDAVVVVGTDAGTADPFAVEVARAAGKAGGIGAGADLVPVADGTAATIAAAGLPAVDHLGTPEGRFSLVWILTGRATGFYGSGSGADGYFPPVGS